MLIGHHVRRNINKILKKQIMSRQLAMKSLRMFAAEDNQYDSIKPKNQVNLKHKTVKQSKNKHGR